MSESLESSIITATLVAEENRLEFYPAIFGSSYLMRGEALVFGFLRSFCAEYTGGYWHFYTLSNGGYYMAPDIDNNVYIEVVGNYFSDVMSSDAAGILATLFTLCCLAEKAQGSTEGEALIDRYHLLLNFVRGHAEADKILRAID